MNTLEDQSLEAPQMDPVDPGTLAWMPTPPILRRPMSSSRELEPSDNRRSPTPTWVDKRTSMHQLDDASPMRGEFATMRARLKPGSIIPSTRLRVLGWLGEGATAIVYRGEHVDLERKLAIKVLRRPPQSDAQSETFLAEARLTASLSSPFIAEVVDFGTLPDGRLYYAMSLAHGRTVASMLEDGPMSPARVITALRMACKALSVAHEAGVVHRDIKPANMMIERSLGRERLVLLDFGIATVAGQTAQLLCGTPSYMAPEQIRSEVIDGRADIYALGCCAYEMLWGTELVVGRTWAEVLDNHLVERAFTPPDEPFVPRAIRAVVERCVQIDPDDRYASAAELEAALCEAQLATSMVAGSDDLEPPQVEPARRDKIAAAMLARRRRRSMPRWILACSLVAGLGLGLVGWQRAQADETRTDRTRIETIAARAITAGDEGVFVYPRPGEDVDTAYSAVVELEGWNGAARHEALAQAAVLRARFAQRLVALGDITWEDPKSRGYARDYYAQALVFQPQAGRARERVGMTQGELAELRHKAEHTSFTPEELQTAEVLLERAQPAPPAKAPSAPRKAAPVRRPDARVSASSTPERDPTVTTAANQDAAADDGNRAHEPGRARRLVRKGRRALARGERDEARGYFEDALELDPGSAAAYGGLADVEFEAGHHDRALRYATLAVGRDRRSAEHRLRLGDSYVRMGRISSAREQYQTAVDLGSRVADVRLTSLEKKGTRG
jgi:tetratricopeptide (TPR) repeat protein/tRNA A-37 threonylcarbamoyl transferase component Bud32